MHLLYRWAWFFLIAAPAAFAKVGYSHDELKSLSAREQAVAAPVNQHELSALIEQSQSLKQEALSMHQHLDNALKGSPLSSVLDIPPASPNQQAQGVMVFVSLSMPDMALRQLLKQSQTYQVPLIIRGVLPEGFVPTTSRIQSLLEIPRGTTLDSGIAISPAWFRQFSITHVPAFVSIGEACSEQRCDEGSYDIVYGNLSLPNALSILSQGDVGHVARNVLERKAP